ncbi:alpha/beta hydrolase-fold protein [Gracilimonas sp.]|uniref:alpha/beta hydrolase-fold protein n=1 Tax=Gracilimonas sp. TaxID=1974203 RepID=UPI0032EC4DC5
MSRKLTLIFSVGLFLINGLYAQQLNYIHHDFSLESEVLDETRSGKVFLPETVQEPLPVLYVLDGEWNHELVSGMVGHFVRWNRIPDMAVVSLDNINRTRDFTPTEDNQRYPGSGGAEKFLEFVEEELIPQMEQEYNLSDYRILFGHSFGGLFSLYTLKSQPELFEAYIAVSPSVWWKDRFMYGEYEFQELNNKPFVYATAGTNDRTNNTAIEEYVSFLEESGNADHLELYSNIHEGEDHFTNVSITLHEGLKKLFPVDKFEQESISAWNEGGKKAIQSWYEHSTSEYGYRFRLPEESIRTYAYNLHAGESKTKEAIELLQWLASVYDESYQVFYFLGAVAAEDGQKELAIQNYRKALEVGNMPPRMRTVIERNLAEVQKSNSGS